MGWDRMQDWLQVRDRETRPSLSLPYSNLRHSSSSSSSSSTSSTSQEWRRDKLQSRAVKPWWWKGWMDWDGARAAGRGGAFIFSSAFNGLKRRGQIRRFLPVSTLNSIALCWGERVILYLIIPEEDKKSWGTFRGQKPPPSPLRPAPFWLADPSPFPPQLARQKCERRRKKRSDLEVAKST